MALAYIARLTRTGLVETLKQEYIRTARAKGLSEWRVVTVHALRGAILPVVSLFSGPALGFPADRHRRGGANVRHSRPGSVFHRRRQ